MMKNKILAGLTAVVLVLGSAMVAKTAVSTLAGLAVAQSSTVWNSVKDAAVGDAQTNGILMSALALFNGSSFDRARGDTTFGLDVDVTRLPGGAQTPSDAFANPTTFSGTWTLVGLFNGTTWDRLRSISATNNTAVTSTGVAYTTQLSTWTLNNAPATATQATVSKAAGGTTVRHVATGVTACLAAGANATGPIIVNLRDGATGAGTVLKAWALSAPVSGSVCIPITGINVTGSANTAMTIEFAGAGAVASQETVEMSGYSTP